ncbi:protein Atossa [Drosophila takahashii]|uniref:protein Atossa n=1 Tax=Drosophila takahashii TaxID=29030 RepID=UPI003898FE70
MIPTSVTNSPPPAGLGQNGASASLGSATAAGGGGMLSGLGISGGGMSTGAGGVGVGAQNNYSSVVLGLASLILEGRPIADDEYQQQQQQQQQVGSGAAAAGRLSPRPSTSRAAINITTNPYGSMGGSENRAAGNGSGSTGSPSSSSLTHQRWTQKLCQLRQISPAAQTMSAEPELVSLAINDLNKDHGGDYEIVRRVMLNRAGGMGGLVSSSGGLGGGGTNNSSAASSPGSNSSDNILHSLQSLATTCLRGGPALAPPPVEPRPLNLAFLWSGSGGGGSGGRGLGLGAAAAAAAASISNTPTTTATATASSGASSSASRPKHGPHCDQFLRKMGLAKGEMPSEAEEHICDMSYVNMTCNRWRAYCMKMEAILARREPVCIEVYLGPVSHKLLLEQWIISGKEKVPPPTMTLPSLCSAIRSQLYFSQIVAWCDLLRKCDPSVYDSGRVIFSGCGNNAGDLATSYTPNGGGQKRPRLNIFYRIKQHTTSSGNSGLHQEDGFSAKANVHNFPNVNVSESYSISVSVRSLPRINGGLPHVEPLPPSPAPRGRRSCGGVGGDPASTPTGGGGLHAATPTGLGARISALTPTTMASGSNCDNGKPGMDELDGDSSLSHRERQLQKYRKRMQRRDKKRERKSTPERESNPQQTEEPMEEGEDSQTQSQSHSPSDSQSLSLTLQQPRRIAMISTGTQTSLSSCQQCGSEKTLLCLSCTGKGGGRAENGAGEVEEGDDSDTTASEMEETSHCSLSSGDLIVGTPRNKAELLLQAIQRTPKNRNRKPHLGGSDLNGGQNNNLVKVTPASSGCQVCKRQKTQHNFANGKAATNGEHKSNGFAREAEKQISSTELTPNIERCSLNPAERCKTPPPGVAEHIVVQFKTPLSQVPAKLQPDAMVPLQQQQQGSKCSPKPSQLRLNCGSGLLESETPPPIVSPQMRKALPKVNLTTIFCSSAPIAIGCPAFSFDPAALSHAHSQLLAPDASATPPVQKSFSAPTLPHAASLSVSPRFAKQALAAHKRRSRHLSDRSDRSSLGSDEQLSDEDLESGLCSPAGGSPLKCRARLAAHFAGRPLLGNLEESLLQRRLMPKIEVMGFKLQLGASGGFCPTQLTIPAVSYFYELHGETLSTPYLCEIRLPRKGYSVPRTGTVQATLLNPAGTVVRMFVIPYDMRDMPPLHRTFIRQRILAEELNQEQDAGPKMPRSPTVTSTTSKLGHFISAEQMKRLRYSIHLRFQTSRSGRLCLHTDIRLLISRRTDCDTAAAHAKGVLEAPNELVTDTMMPAEPRYSARQESAGRI